MTARPHFPRISANDNYIWLLAALLVLLFVSSVGQQTENYLLTRLMGISMMGVILVAVWSLERGRLRFASRAGISILFIVVESSVIFFEKYDMRLLQLGTLLLFTIASVVICCRQALFTGSVDSNKIVGAICIYFLMGIAWAQAYLIVEVIFPGSIPALAGEHWQDNAGTALYFSFVTLSTVGFGDIVPAQPLARHLASIQAIAGQFYVAIVVASLIGARLSSKGGE